MPENLILLLSNQFKHQQSPGCLASCKANKAKKLSVATVMDV